MEECVLGARLFTDQILNIVDYKSVDTLVETYKFIYAARGGAYSSRILAFEKTCCDIQYASLRICFFQTYAYGLYEMCFTDASRPEYEKRVECLAFRILPMASPMERAILLDMLPQ